MLQAIIDFVMGTGFFAMTLQQLIMIFISFLLLYLAIKKGFEPLLLVPIAFGMLLTNLPLAGMMNPHSAHEPGESSLVLLSRRSSRNFSSYNFHGCRYDDRFWTTYC